MDSLNCNCRSIWLLLKVFDLFDFWKVRFMFTVLNSITWRLHQTIKNLYPNVQTLLQGECHSVSTFCSFRRRTLLPFRFSGIPLLIYVPHSVHKLLRQTKMNEWMKESLAREGCVECVKVSVWIMVFRDINDVNQNSCI